VRAKRCEGVEERRRYIERDRDRVLTEEAEERIPGVSQARRRMQGSWVWMSRGWKREDEARSSDGTPVLSSAGGTLLLPLALGTREERQAHD
jgi:hypothetical protein